MGLDAVFVGLVVRGILLRKAWLMKIGPRVIGCLFLGRIYFFVISLGDMRNILLALWKIEWMLFSRIGEMNPWIIFGALKNVGTLIRTISYGCDSLMAAFSVGTHICIVYICWDLSAVYTKPK